MRLLFAIVLISGIYDVLLGGALLFALEEMRQLLGTEPPRFPINANLNGLFALAIGIGYFAILKNPEDHRWYLWIMGPLLKGGGAVLFVLDFALRNSPPAFLAFAVTDGALAVATAVALARTIPRGPETSKTGPGRE